MRFHKGQNYRDASGFVVAKQTAILLTTPRELGQQTGQKRRTPEDARAARYYSLGERPPIRQFPSPYNGDIFGIIQVNNHSAIIISQHILL
jgi:hypothetical protein